MSPAPARAVYTALLGGYERLLEQPVATSSDVPFICFTDDPKLTSATWQVRVIEPALPGDLVRSSRILKIRGHAGLADFDETLWIDNSVLLQQDPGILLDTWLAEADLAMPAHSFRSTVAAEFDAVLNAGRDDPATLDEQLASYTAHHVERLDLEVMWTALLARRWSDATRRTMEVWLDHVLRYSRRDQLSIANALAESEQQVTVVEIDNRSSEWHRWPMAKGRPALPPELPPRWPLGSDPQRLARLRAQIDEVTIQFNRSVMAREAEVQHLLSSRSWRITGPLRRTADLARPVWQRLRHRARGR